MMGLWGSVRKAAKKIGKKAKKAAKSYGKHVKKFAKSYGEFSQKAIGAESWHDYFLKAPTLIGGTLAGVPGAGMTTQAVFGPPAPGTSTPWYSQVFDFAKQGFDAYLQIQQQIAQQKALRKAGTPAPYALQPSIIPLQVPTASQAQTSTRTGPAPWWESFFGIEEGKGPASLVPYIVVAGALIVIVVAVKRR